MRIDPHRLLVLRAVRRTGSIQAAARALYLTASGVSQHLTRLESETGLCLVDRSQRGGGRSVRLTTAGLSLAEKADDVAAALGLAQQEAERLRDGSDGRVHVGGFATALSQLVAPTLQQVAVSDPWLLPTIVEVAAADGVRQLRTGELDLLITERRSDAVPGHPGLVEHDLCRDQYRIVVPALWPAGQDLAELLAGPWVTSLPGERSHQILDQFRARYQIDASVQHVCTESRTMVALVAAGLGAAVIPDLTLSALPTAGVRVHNRAIEIGSRVLTVLAPDLTTPGADRFRQLLVQVADSTP